MASRGPHLPDASTSSSLSPPPRSQLSLIVPFRVWFCDSFKDASMPQNSHRSQPSLSCRRLTVIANICLTRCSPASLNTLSSSKSQINMILPPSFQILPASHMPGQISDSQTHIHTGVRHRIYLHRDPEVRRSSSPRIPHTPTPTQTHKHTHDRTHLHRDPKVRRSSSPGISHTLTLTHTQTHKHTHT